MIVRALLSLAVTACMSSTALAGFELGAGLGVNTCVPDEAANCERLWPMVDLSAALEVRGDRFGLGLEFDYGWLTPTGDGSDAVQVQTMHLMPVLRAYMPLKDCAGWPEGAEAFAGFGFGWSDQRQVDIDSGDEISSFSTLIQGVKLSLGAVWPIGDAGLAFSTRADLFINTYGESCVGLSGARDCQEVDGTQDVAETLHAVGELRYRF